MPSQLVEQADDRGVGFRQVTQVDRVAFETVGDVEDQPAPVLGDGAVGVVPRILGDRVDERVVGLRLAERVPVDADLLLVVALAVRALSGSASNRRRSRPGARTRR